MTDAQHTAQDRSPPPPLVPPEVDLSSFSYMKLDVRRLRDSRLASLVTGEEFRAAVLLWCASWHQRPAGSLPTNDVELAQLAGFGRSVADWKAVAENALHGWVECSDGRLYHPVVVEKALEAWAEKLDLVWRRECDRIRKENKQRSEAVPKLAPLPMPDKPIRAGFGIPAEALRNSVGVPADSSLIGKERRGEDSSSPSQGAGTSRGSSRGRAGHLDEEDPFR